MSRAASTLSQRLTAVAAIATALLAAAVLFSMWAFLFGFSKALDNDHTGPIITEVACTHYATGVLDLHAQGYSANQITQTLARTRGHDEAGSYLFEGCGTPKQIIDTAGPIK